MGLIYDGRGEFTHTPIRVQSNMAEAAWRQIEDMSSGEDDDTDPWAAQAEHEQKPHIANEGQVGGAADVPDDHVAMREVPVESRHQTHHRGSE